jgi:CRP-like cAMP-binding protein
LSSASGTLRSVRWLASLGERALDEVVDAADSVAFAAGQVLVGELEVGDHCYLVLDGQARVTVAAGASGDVELGRLGPGDTCGELALLTHELRSATVTAIDRVTALRLDRAAFEALIARHPEIAAHFAREIGQRLADGDRALDALLHQQQPLAEATRSLSGRTAAVSPVRGSLGRAWRELVVAHRQDLPFLALAGFVATMCAVRASVWLFETTGAPLFGLLRAAYTTGIALVIVSAATSFMRFSARVRRWIAIAYGVGFALIFNELSVFLAFDTFYLDMTTRDPNLIFDVEVLYRRAESQWAVALALAVLIQATYLRRFYSRARFILASRLRGRR